MEVNKITIKRINGDYKLFEKSDPQFFDVLANPDNILEIFFLMYGRDGTPYEGGQYIGKIVHSPEYPRKAPDYYMLTPNGRFLVSILEGFSSVWHSEIKEDKHGISHIASTPPEQIKNLASQSVQYNVTSLVNLYPKFSKVKKNYNPYAKTPTINTNLQQTNITL